jgi:HNH endonuclease
MTTYIPAALRAQVKTSAADRCEYCLIPDDLSVKRHEVDHICAEKHNGATVFPNLCLSCYYCNHHKGSDLCSIDPITDELVGLFHPRRERWLDHFVLNGSRIEGKNPTGRVTVALLQMNTPDRIAERQILIRLSRYP